MAMPIQLRLNLEHGALDYFTYFILEFIIFVKKWVNKIASLKLLKSK